MNNDIEVKHTLVAIIKEGACAKHFGCMFAEKIGLGASLAEQVVPYISKGSFHSSQPHPI